MGKALKYKVNICENGMRIKSINHLGTDLVGVVYENQSFISYLKVCSLSDGNLLWEKRIEEAVDGGTRPIFDEQNIYVPYGNAHITANNPQTGDERWKAPISTSLCCPLAQTAGHIMEVNCDNSNYRIIDKKDGAIVSKGKLKHKHPHYNENIYPWNGNFVAVGESRSKPVLGIYAPDGFIQNMVIPTDELIELNRLVLEQTLLQQSFAADCLYFGSIIGNLYRFNLKAGAFDSKISLNANFDVNIFSTVSLNQMHSVMTLYDYSNMVAANDFLYFIAKEFAVNKKMVCYICKYNLKTGAFSSEIADIEAINYDKNRNDLQVLENGVGVCLSEKGLVTFNLIDGNIAETDLDDWADVIKHEYREPDHSFSGLFNFKYGRQWIVADGKLIVMRPTDETGELFCWEL